MRRQPDSHICITLIIKPETGRDVAPLYERALQLLGIYDRSTIIAHILLVVRPPLTIARQLEVWHAVTRLYQAPKRTIAPQYSVLKGIGLAHWPFESIEALYQNSSSFTMMPLVSHQSAAAGV